MALKPKVAGNLPKAKRAPGSGPQRSAKMPVLGKARHAAGK